MTTVIIFLSAVVVAGYILFIKLHPEPESHRRIEPTLQRRDKD